jgi:hypothetical protein
MELEIKINELTDAIERIENDGRTFNSFEEELEYLNQKYRAKYIKHCDRVKQAYLESDEYVPANAGFFRRIKASINHYKNLFKRICKGDIYETKDEWVIPYDPIRDVMLINVHIPTKEWDKLKKKWKIK